MATLQHLKSHSNIASLYELRRLIRAYEAVEERLALTKRVPADLRPVLCEAYQDLWRFVTDSEHYRPLSPDFKSLADCLDDFPRLVKTAQEPAFFHNWAASPRFHMVCCVAANRAGHQLTMNIEHRAGEALLSGIAATGDGSADEPWLIVRPDDANDFIEFWLHKRKVGQRITRAGDRWLDEISLDDETSPIYFDITKAYEKMGRSFRRL